MKKPFLIIAIIVIVLKFLDGSLNLESILMLLLSLDENEIINAIDEIKTKSSTINFKPVFKNFIKVLILTLALLAFDKFTIKTIEPSITITDGPQITTNEVPSVTMDEVPSVTLN